MTRYFNHHLVNHFRTCPVIAKSHDPHRGRNVTLHAIPDEFELVGICDGVDAWVAPATTAPFHVDCVRLLKILYSGDDFEVFDNRPQQMPLPLQRRRAVVQEPRRRSVIAS